MCYIIAKHRENRGCVAYKTKFGSSLPKLVDELEALSPEGTQIVIISRPSAYGEYAPYTFVDSPDKLKELIINNY